MQVEYDLHEGSLSCDARLDILFVMVSAFFVLLSYLNLKKKMLMQCLKRLDH